MTDEVAVAVLSDNHAQNATLAAEVTSARSLLDAHERFIRRLERSGRLLRSVEALPDDRQLAERRRDGQALTSPELSVLLAYAKLQAGTEVLQSGLPDDPALEELLIDYFPAPLRERFPAAVTGHPLRREIVATALTNRAVNIAGVTGLFRLAQETGVPLDRVVRAHAVARAVFDVDRLWDAVRPLDNVVSATTQVELRTEATRLAERTARWLLRQPELADEPAPADRRRAGPVRRARRRGAGRAARLAAGPARPRRTPSAPRGCRRPGCRRSWPPRSPPRRCCRRRSTWRSSASGPARPSSSPGRSCSAWPSGSGWCRCASWSSRCRGTAAGRRWPGPRCATTSPWSRRRSPRTC